MGYYVYKDSAEQWRWRYLAANYQIIAVSSESYFNKQDCLNSIAIMQRSSSSEIYEVSH